MKSKINYLISLLLGLLIIMSVAGIPVEVFNHPKTFAVFGMAGISLIISFLCFIAPQKDIKFSRLNIFCFLFLLLYVIDFSHLNTIWNIGYLCLLSLFIASHLLQQIHYIIIFKSLLGTAVLLTIWGYLQYFEYIPSNSEYFRITGPFHNPAVFAIILSLLLSIALNSIILFYRSLINHKFFLVFIITVVLFCIPLLILTYARAAYLALFVSVLYCFYLKLRNNGKGRKIKLYYSAGVLFVILISIGMLYKLKPQSANGRFLVWKISCRMIQDKPLTGFGKGGFAANYLYYQADYMKSFASPEERRLAGSTHLAFNEPLRITVEYGLIGLIIYSSFIIWILFLSTNRTTVCVLFKAFLAGIVIWGMFGYPDQVFSIQALWIIAIACYLNKNFRTTYEFSGTNRLLSKIVIIVICGTSSFLGMKLWNKWTSYHELYTCLDSQSFQSISQASNIFVRLQEEMIDDINFAYLYCQLTKMRHQEIEFLRISDYLERSFPTPGLLLMKGDYFKKKSRWKEAEEAYKLASDMMPSLQLPRGKLAFLYNETGRKEEAVAIAHDILTEDVKVYSFSTFDLHRDLRRIFEDELK